MLIWQPLRRDRWCLSWRAVLLYIPCNLSYISKSSALKCIFNMWRWIPDDYLSLYISDIRLSYLKWKWCCFLKYTCYLNIYRYIYIFNVFYFYSKFHTLYIHGQSLYGKVLRYYSEFYFTSFQMKVPLTSIVHPSMTSIINVFSYSTKVTYLYIISFAILVGSYFPRGMNFWRYSSTKWK